MATPRKQRALEIVAGRDRIPPEDAIQCLGRAWPGHLKDYGLAADSDGLLDASEVISALDRLQGRRQINRLRAYPWDAQLELRRLDGLTWMIHAPWGPLAQMWPTSYSGAALSRPAAVLGVWKIAIPVDDEFEQVFGAVSSDAAQVLAARHAAPQIVLPAWAEEVRELDHEIALQVQEAATAKYLREEIPQGDLTDWEVRHLDPRLNPALRLWRQAGIDGDMPNVAAVAELSTPRALVLKTDGNPLQRQRWGAKAVARELGVKPTTVRSWLSRGQMPDPDGRDDAGRAWWLPDTIRQWNANRPGQGARTDRPTRETGPHPEG